MTDRGWYLYGIIRGASKPIREWPGIDPRFRLQTIVFKDLIAVTSCVDLETLTPVSGRRPAPETSVSWLTAKALAHQRIVEELFSRGTIIPARFGMVFRSRARVQAILEQHYQHMWFLLQRLADRVEMGVKVFSNPEALHHRLRQIYPELQSLARQVEACEGGKTYLLRRQLERKTEELARNRCLVDAASIARELAGAAEEARNLECPAGMAGTTGTLFMLFNGTYLIARDRGKRFRCLIAGLQRQMRDAGVLIVVNGPWPPYSFSSLEELAPVPEAEVQAL